MHKLKTIYQTCTCGKMNGVEIKRTIHNRISFCPVCDDYVYRHSQLMYLMNSNISDVFKHSTHFGSFENFAVAWGA